MKKLLLFAAGAVLLAATVSIFVYVKNEDNPMEGLFNANVEALAGGESGTGCSGPKEATLVGGEIVCRCRNSKSCRDNYGCN